VIDRLRAIASSHRVRRWVLGFYTALLALTIAGYMGVSWLELQTVAYVRGESVLYQDRPFVVRGVVRDAPTGKSRSRVEVGFFLLEPNDEEAGDDKHAGGDTAEGEGREGALLGTLEPDPSGVFEGSFEVPDEMDPGRYDLAVRAQGPTMEPFEAFSTVEVREEGGASPEWPTRTSRISSEERREQLASGPVRSKGGSVAIDLLPPDGELSRGLPNRVYVRTYDADTGEPVPARVEFVEVEGMGRWSGEGAGTPESVETDVMGLAEISLRPVGGQRWRLRAEALEEPSGADPSDGEGLGEPGEDTERSASLESTGTATLRVHTVPTQVAVSVRRPMVGSARRLRGKIRSPFESGALTVDFYSGEDWLVASRLELKDRRADLDFEVPDLPGTSWLGRIQLARGFYDAGSNWETQYVVDAAELEGSGVGAALRRLADWIAEHREDAPYFEHLAEAERVPWATAGSSDREMWLRAFTAAIPRHFSRPETLFNTKRGDLEALESWKQDVQSHLMYGVAFGLAGGLAMLLYAVVVGIRRHREHAEQLRQVDTDLAGEDFDESLREEEMMEGDYEFLMPRDTAEKIQAILLGVVAFATFAMFAAGILMLLSYM